MKALLGSVLLVLSALAARGQEVELPPIVVSGTFELRQGPSAVDLFTLHLQKQIETKSAVEEIMARSPWYYSRLWNYFPMRIESSSIDPSQFFAPQYLSLESQNQEWMLRKSEKHSVFDR